MPHLFHRWTRWETYTVYLWQGTRDNVVLTEGRQQRECEICGRLQEKSV